MRVISRSEQGNVRNNNEDFCAYREIGEYKVLAIADGIGGIEGGEIASRTAVESVISDLEDELAEIKPAELKDKLNWYFQKANTAILKETLKNPALKGMGTTLSVAIQIANKVYISHIGDTRVYLVHGNSITQLTKDHSIDNKLTKSLGVNEFIEPDNYCYNIIYGDLLLLTTDGIHGVMEDHQILQCVKKHNYLDTCIVNLFDEAYKNGSKDNVTALILHVKPN